MMELPERRGKKRQSPGVLLIYSKPKSGKTTLCSMLEDHLILECEPGGADFVEGRIIDIDKPSQFSDAIKTIESNPTKVCKYLVVDTTSKLDEWSEIVGTYNYMTKPQGKKFNISEDGKKISHTDTRFETVHELANGFGYQHSRNVMLEWYDRLLNLITIGKVDHLILLSHVKDKLIETKKGDTVESIDINLTGKVKSIYASRVDAVAYLSRKDGKGTLNFSNDNNIVCGGRCPHLDGEIVISEKTPEGIKSFWEKVYID